MEKLFIIGLAFLFGSLTVENRTPDKPKIHVYKANKEVRPTFKPSPSHAHYIIKDYDPN